jgi:hypothetical protein
VKAVDSLPRRAGGTKFVIAAKWAFLNKEMLKKGAHHDLAGLFVRLHSDLLRSSSGEVGRPKPDKWMRNPAGCGVSQRVVWC